MGIELGRISGPLLSENLLRNGVDLAVDTKLLYLDVTNGYIGINTDIPVRPLTVAGSTKLTNLLVDTQASIAALTVSTNNIQNLTGSIYVKPNQSVDPVITVKEAWAGNFKLTNGLINNDTLNSDINLSALGTGVVAFYSDTVNVNGSLHATGDITFDGTITFGNASTDTVVFRSDIASNIVPDTTNTYALGTLTNQWNKLYSVNVNSTTLTTPALTVNNINMLLTQGNTIYVSVNGTDINTGTHVHSAYKTIKHALLVATTGTEIVIFPGTYTEDFPLTIPQGVTITGAGIRSVLIQPSVDTNSNDAFLLNGETTVSFLTVQNFFYNVTNNTGYAFRFAPNIKVTTRSPYIFNVTVITKGSVTSVSDPLGFNQGDAGAGVFLDASVANPSSYEASGLFYSVTFITPNQDGITLTNGARAEWLNSFTYYAKRGIYLTTGTLGFASLGIKFGAEIRSISSANVYGTYGAVSDGLHTLGYLIGHNFGYIGTGANSQNDRSLTIQGNEIVPIGGGELYYDSMDHRGNYRVGNIFYVDQETGQVAFNAQSITFTEQGSITLNGVNGSIIVNATTVQSGKIRLHDNIIDSISGPVNFYAFSGSTYLNTDVFVTGLVAVTGDANIKGNITFGNQSTDTINIFDRLTQTIKPDLNNTYNLGSISKIWQTAFATSADIDSVTLITNNTISTLSANTDLVLSAVGTGKLHISTTDIQVDNNLAIGNMLTVNGSSTVQSVNINGDVILAGNIDQTGNTHVIGTFANYNISSNGVFAVTDIKLDSNKIVSTATDADLIITANGVGGVVIDSRLKIVDNVISNVWASATTNLQKSILFTPNGTGNTVINSTKSLVIPYGNNTTRTLSAYGEIRQNSTTGWYEGYLPSAPIRFNNLYDVDYNTYITPELTVGLNDNLLRFGINGAVKATISSTILASPTLQVDNVNITTNTIRNSNSATDLELYTSGSGLTNINNVFLDNGSIITNVSSGALTLASTGTGYIKFGGSAAVVFPTGPTGDRRDTPELGEVRNNTTLDYMEVFNGTIWIPAVGTLGAAPLGDVLDTMDAWSLILG